MSKYISYILLLILVGSSVKAQFPTQSTPTQYSTGWFRQGWPQADSGTILASRLPNFTPRFPGTIILYQQAGIDSSIYYYNGGRWLKLSQFDSTSLSNRINLKLNITDTTNHWWGLGKRWVDSLYRKNDSTIAFTINGSAEQTFQILGRSSSGPGSGLTSVGLSMPSAFTVTNSPLTSNGVLNVTMPGLSTQYVRANGTIATTDTGMIPNFYLKVRSLLTGTSPITFNQATGAIGIPNANNTGQKGAATFNNTDFTDNGAGLISLRNPAAFPGVDSIWRVPGVDSIYFTISSVQRAILDSLGATITASNGLTKVGNDIRLGDASGPGAPLIHDSYIDASTFKLNISGSNSSNAVLSSSNSSGGYGLEGASSSASGVGVHAVNTSGGTGLLAEVLGGKAASFTAIAGLPLYMVSQPSNANSNYVMGEFHRQTSGTAAAGIAQSFDFYSQLNNSTNDTIARTIVTTTNATAGSQSGAYDIWLKNNGGTLSQVSRIASTGQQIWPKYPGFTAQTDTTTYKPIAIDGSGNVVKMIGWTMAPQTLQQVFNQGSTLTKHDTIYQAGKMLVTNGQFINKDTTRSGYIASHLVFGPSIDAGFTHDNIRLISNWVQQASGALGLFNWNRALSGTTLIQHSAGDSSMQNRLYSIPNWDSTLRYIIIGTYPVNDVLLSDSSQYATALSAMIDSLHINRNYPLNYIIVLNGTPAPARGSGLPLLAAAALHTAVNKGVRYFDSYNYLLTDLSNIDIDSLHLNIKGQYNLAIGLLNALTTYDSVQYIRANNGQFEQAISVNGKAYFYNGYYSTGNDSTAGKLAVNSDISIHGNFLRVATFNSGVTITGDNVINGQKWLAYRNNNQRYGVGVATTTSNWLRLFSDGFNNDGVQLGQISTSDGTTFTEYFHVNNNETKAFNQIVGTSGANISGTTTIANLSVTGANSIGQEWNLFSNSGLKFGVRMDGSSPYYTHVYTGYNVSNNAVSLDWMDSDGTTLHPILKAQKNGIVNIVSLTNQNDTSTYKPLVANSSGDIYKMVGWPTGSASQSLQQTFNQGSILTKHDTIYQNNYLLSTNGQFINKDTTRYAQKRILQAFGVSIDAGIGSPAGSPSWVSLVAGSLGDYNWNRATSGTTLITHGAVPDSSMEAKLPYIPVYDASTHSYIIIGNYQVNECNTWSVDSSTWRTHLSNMIDSLHGARLLYPLQKIVVLTGTPVPGVATCMNNLRLATIHVCAEKGVRCFDSWTYLNSDHSNLVGDSLHLSFRGQMNLSYGLLNSSTFDSVQNISANVLNIYKAATLHGDLYVRGNTDRLGNDSIHGNMAIMGTLRLMGHMTNRTFIDSSLEITGANLLDGNSAQKWRIYKNDGGGVYERMGIGHSSYSGSGTLSLFVPGYNGTGVTFNQISTGNGSTETPIFHADNLITRVHSSDFIANGTSHLNDVTTIGSGLKVVGNTDIDEQKWRLYKNDGGGNHQRWGFGIDNGTGSVLRIFTDAFSGRSVEMGNINLTDSTTFTRKFRFETVSGNAYIYSLSSGGTAPTTSGTTKMVISDANGLLSFDNIPTPSTTIYNGDGTLSGTRTVSGGGNSLNFGTGGSKVNLFTVNSSSRTVLNSGITYGVDATNTDADYTVPGNIIIAEVSDVLSTARTLTMPSASTNGQMITLVMRFSSGTNKYSLSSAITDNATGSTFTTLDWGKTYDFMVDQGLAWRLIRKY